jgi:hypothetical protein
MKPTSARTLAVGALGLVLATGWVSAAGKVIGLKPEMPQPAVSDLKPALAVT